MTSVIVFVLTVDWLRCKANCQTLLGGDDSDLSEERRVKECKHVDRIKARAVALISQENLYLLI